MGRHNEKDDGPDHSMKIDSTSPAMSKIESSSSPSGGEGIRFDKHATTEEIIGGTISVCGPQTSDDVSPQPASLSMHANPEDSHLVDARLSGSNKQIEKILSESSDHKFDIEWNWVKIVFRTLSQPLTKLVKTKSSHVH